MKPVGRGRIAARDRLQRLAAVHRRGRVGRERDPPLDHRERLARRRSSPCPTSCSTTPASPPTSGSVTNRKTRRAAGQGAADRRPRVFAEDAQEPGRQAQARSADAQIDEITRLYGDFARGRHCKIFDNEDFGYRRITVERPLRPPLAHRRTPRLSRPGRQGGARVCCQPEATRARQQFAAGATISSLRALRLQRLRQPRERGGDFPRALGRRACARPASGSTPSPQGDHYARAGRTRRSAPPVARTARGEPVPDPESARHRRRAAD